MNPRQLILSILPTLLSQDTEFLCNSLRPDLLLIPVNMFAFIAVIVKRETRLPLPLTASKSSKFKVQSARAGMVFP
jgi:hypothetical protein